MATARVFEVSHRGFATRLDGGSVYGTAGGGGGGGARGGGGGGTPYFFAAFFADCRHQLHEVTSGRRLCLLYNLVRTGIPGSPTSQETAQVAAGAPAAASALPCPEDAHASRRATIAAAVADWVAEGDGAPEKLALCLSHKYTKRNLSFGGLKERDRVLAALLRDCRDTSTGEPLPDLGLAIVCKRVRGVAESHPYRNSYYGGRRGGWGGYSEEEDDSDELLLFLRTFLLPRSR